jgi:hypothetical protein
MLNYYFSLFYQKKIMISTIIEIHKNLKQEYNKNNILLYIKSCVIIQKYYKGFYIRNKIKNFYKLLF